jgi:hypothetical protein
MSGVALIGEAPTIDSDGATRHPKVTYKGVVMEWDYYRRAPGLSVLHTVCPRCAQFGLIASANKRFHVDDRGRVSVDEPFRCDYCHWRFGVTDGQMFDA